MEDKLRLCEEELMFGVQAIYKRSFLDWYLKKGLEMNASEETPIPIKTNGSCNK